MGDFTPPYTTTTTQTTHTHTHTHQSFPFHSPFIFLAHACSAILGITRFGMRSHGIHLESFVAPMIPVYISYDMTDGPPFRLFDFLEANCPFLVVCVAIQSAGAFVGDFSLFALLTTPCKHRQNSNLETRGAKTGIRCIVAKILGSGFSIRLSDGKGAPLSFREREGASKRATNTREGGIAGEGSVSHLRRGSLCFFFFCFFFFAHHNDKRRIERTRETERDVLIDHAAVRRVRGVQDTETSIPLRVQSAFKDLMTQSSAIRITYRISLRSSSLQEPRYPLLKVIFCYSFCFNHKRCANTFLD